MRRSRLREASIRIAFVGAVILGCTIYFSLTQITPKEIRSEEVEVSKVGFEKHRTKFGVYGWSIHIPTDYYEFAIYSGNRRFFLRNPDLKTLSSKVPFLAKGDFVKIWHADAKERDRGHRVMQIEKEGRLTYSLTEHDYENKKRNWFMFCVAAAFLVISSILYYISPSNE